MAYLEVALILRVTMQRITGHRDQIPMLFSFKYEAQTALLKDPVRTAL
jgi:hypothetical protein